jgi:thiamine biosynthesis protein ThiS
VNGEPLILPDRDQIGIPELLAHLQLENPAFATIILNGKPLDVGTRNDTILHDTDHIDILQYVAGG